MNSLGAWVAITLVLAFALGVATALIVIRVPYPCDVSKPVLHREPIRPGIVDKV